MFSSSPAEWTGPNYSVRGGAGPRAATRDPGTWGHTSSPTSRCREAAEHRVRLWLLCFPARVHSSRTQPSTLRPLLLVHPEMHPCSAGLSPNPVSGLGGAASGPPCPALAWGGPEAQWDRSVYSLLISEFISLINFGKFSTIFYIFYSWKWLFKSIHQIH